MYANRHDAGKRLAQVLQHFTADNAVALGTSRGGAMVASIVAQELHIPFGVILIRTISHPESRTHIIGAIAEGEQPILMRGELSDIDNEWLEHAVTNAQKQIIRYRKLYYGDDIHPPILAHKTAFLIDDGITTGLTMAAAIKFVRGKHVEKIIVAVPAAPIEAVIMLENLADQIITLDDPNTFQGTVAANYHDFHQVTDAAVSTLLRETHHEI